MTTVHDPSAAADIQAGWLDRNDPDRHLIYATEDTVNHPIRQIVYRNSVDDVAVDVVHADYSHTARTSLLPGVPATVSAGLLAERRGLRLIDEALTS